MITMLVEIVSVIFIGHLNDSVILGGVGLGTLLINITLMSIGIGLNGAIDTLVSQAYGNKQFYLCGAYLNRGLICQIFLFIPGSIICANGKRILMYLGQDDDTSEAAIQYIFYLVPGMFAMNLFETIRRYLQAMGNFDLTMYIQLFTFITHIGVCYLFVIYLGMGIKGASLAI